MDDNRLYHILADASHTIEHQRQQIAALAPRAEAFDRIGQVLDMVSGRADRAYGEDINWKIQCAMEEIHARMFGEENEKAADTVQADMRETRTASNAGVDMSGLGATLGRIGGEPISDEKKPAPRPGTKYKPDSFA